MRRAVGVVMLSVAEVSCLGRARCAKHLAVGSNRMDSQVIADVIREVGRHASDVAHRPRQNVYDDVPYEAADTISARVERSIEVPAAPVSGPEYTGRA